MFVILIILCYLIKNFQSLTADQLSSLDEKLDINFAKTSHCYKVTSTNSTLKMEAIYFYEILVTTYSSTRRDKPRRPRCIFFKAVDISDLTYLDRTCTLFEDLLSLPSQTIVWWSLLLTVGNKEYKREKALDGMMYL